MLLLTTARYCYNALSPLGRAVLWSLVAFLIFAIGAVPAIMTAKRKPVISRDCLAELSALDERIRALIVWARPDDPCKALEILSR